MALPQCWLQQPWERVTDKQKAASRLTALWTSCLWTMMIFTWLKLAEDEKNECIHIHNVLGLSNTCYLATCTHKHASSSFMGHCSIKPHTHTHMCSAGHRSTAYCDSCRCRNGNFNEVGTAEVVSSLYLAWENGTLPPLSKNGPVISLEMETKPPVSPSPNPNPLCAPTVNTMFSFQLFHFYSFSSWLSPFSLSCCTEDAELWLHTSRKVD